MIRVLAMLAGLAGALTLSQFPEFSQQYRQRLSGAVNELRLVVVGFDTAAAAAGQSREEALAAMGARGFEGQLKDTFTRSIRRYERLNADLAALRGASPLKRLARPWNMADAELVRATWAEFRPAVPATTDGALSAGIGYLGGWAAVVFGLAALRRVFRRRKVAGARA